uniref:Uncharacterized protein n=1 Tax=Oryza brachyantha TaxID=4533 RepID=J3MZF7_ORYBR
MERKRKYVCVSSMDRPWPWPWLQSRISQALVVLSWGWLALLPSNRYGFHSNVTTHEPTYYKQIAILSRTKTPSVKGKGKGKAKCVLMD